MVGGVSKGDKYYVKHKERLSATLIARTRDRARYIREQKSIQIETARGRDLLRIQTGTDLVRQKK